MILVDTAVWIDHLRTPDEQLRHLMATQTAMGHPYVLGEVALGSIANRKAVLALIGRLPQVDVADPKSVLALIERAGLASSGLGYVDAHLLTSCWLSKGIRLWTRDRRLKRAADSLNLSILLH